NTFWPVSRKWRVHAARSPAAEGPAEPAQGLAARTSTNYSDRGHVLFRPFVSDSSKPASRFVLAFECWPTRIYRQLARPWITDPASEISPTDLASPTRR